MSRIVLATANIVDYHYQGRIRLLRRSAEGSIATDWKPDITPKSHRRSLLLILISSLYSTNLV